ncbi:MepB family protein [Candidatus Berkiella aquae]|uniref:MepB family protein n=1 Tax=Candidatus Berkiella aquae TaxID=295108 RepID=A0A0Q9Z2C4_9GAMM|nr:MepB family protein [Candidatus Berkiella aquae]MCS5711926.1 MepB family protein [Candidatus Berkiella aquae]
MLEKAALPLLLQKTIDLVYHPNSFQCSQLQIVPECREYSGYQFKLNSLSIQFRIAKITPTKIGQFVTLWKRIGQGPIQPYDASDHIDFVVICTQKDNQFGQFVFPKSVLLDNDIFSHHNQGGKRALRVYPRWDQSSSKQAQKTQSWQLKYFLEMPNLQSVDHQLVRTLYQF